MIRVLVVEDSPTVAQLLISMLESDPGLCVVGHARDGREAVLEAQRLRPDLITMDVNMPVLDGLAATKEIMTVAPTPIIVVSSAANQSSVDLSLDAMAAGALMVLPKPDGPAGSDFESEREQLVNMARAMSQVKVVRRWPQRTSAAALAGGSARPVRQKGDRPCMVLIGCSTGGPAALRELFSVLPASFPLPVAVVQHIARGFVGGLARWLDSGSQLRVRVARDGDVLKAGTVYLAPDDRHLEIGRDGRVHLASSMPVGGFRPSISRMFESAAESVGAGAVGVLLTGMGNDGVSGMAALRDAGSPLLVQDEESSVVFGMAQEAIRAGLPDAVLPISGIASRLAELAAR